MADRQSSGSAATPLKFRTTAARQTEAQGRTTRTTYRQPPRADDEDENPNAWTPPKTHTSSVRYDRPVRQTAYMDRSNPKKTRQVRERPLDRYTLMMVGSLILIFMVGGYWAFTSLSTWWMNWQDDLHYGNPRTYQTDQFVNQGDSPAVPDHFIAVNINGRVVVVQLNIQHPELDQTYGITTTDPKNPVSLFFRQAGKSFAMYVVIGETAPYTVELVSNGTKFIGTH